MASLYYIETEPMRAHYTFTVALEDYFNFGQTVLFFITYFVKPKVLIRSALYSLLTTNINNLNLSFQFRPNKQIKIYTRYLKSVILNA